MRSRHAAQAQYKCPYLATHNVIHATHGIIQGFQLTDDEETNFHGSLRLVLEALLIGSPDQSFHIPGILLDAGGEHERRVSAFIILCQL